jgi:hypothetical protein
VTSQKEAQRLETEHHLRDPRKVHDLTKHDHAPKAEHYQTGGTLQAAVGNGTFTVDLAEFEALLQNLGQQCDDFAAHVGRSADLTSPLPDGSGPVAETVGAQFTHRLGSSGGMHYVMTRNLESLSDITQTLRTMMTRYQQSEAAAVEAMSQVPDAGTAL